MLLNRGTTKLETERLELDKFSTNDVVSFYDLVGSDTNVTKYVVWNAHKDVDVTKCAVKKWMEGYNNDFTYYWVIRLKDTNEAIGSISCVRVDVKNETCELGYVISSREWNKGIATEALKAIIGYLQEEGFKTIFAEHLKLNPASGRVMEKAGMTFEGILRNRMIDKNTGKYDDLVSYSIITNE